MIPVMSKPTIFQTGKRRRGNPDWGKIPRPIPALLTEFEMQVERLGLSKAHYATSPELKRWCDRNRSRVYVPEWLLEEWGMTVNSFSDVA